MNSFYLEVELQELNFKSIGEDVSISRRAVFYSTENIGIGNHVRIDDFCFVSGGSGIQIGNYVHIATYSALYGKFGIEIRDNVNISSRVNIYSTSDDYSGMYLTGPMVDEEFINDLGRKILIEKMIIIGAGSILLPRSIIIPVYQIFAGIPARFIKKRSKKMLEYFR